MKNQNPVPQLIQNLINDTLQRIPISKSGTYNKQDPTHFERGWIQFQYEGKDIIIMYEDCTWGINFKIEHFREHLSNILLHEVYVEPNMLGNPFTLNWRTKSKGFYKLLKTFIKSHEVVPEKDPDYYDDCPHGCPSSYI